MEQIVKVFLGVYLILYMTLASIGIISVHLQILNAQDLHAKMIDLVAESNYDMAVIDKCFRDAQQNNGVIQMTFYFKNSTSRTYTRKPQDGISGDDIEMAKIDLTFHVYANFIGLNRKFQLTGFAK